MTPQRRVLRCAQDQPVQRDLAQHAERRRDVAMRQRALDLHLSGADHRAALQQRTQAINHLGRQLAQVGQHALLCPTLLVAVALPQQHADGDLRLGTVLMKMPKSNHIQAGLGKPTWTQNEANASPTG